MIRRLAIALFVLGFVCAASADTKLNGAGATFPNPIYTKWFSEYNKLHPDVQINYASIGSGGGIAQLSSGTVDFGASDMPLPDDKLKETSDKLKVRVFHFPTVLGAVVPAYNVSGVTAELKFTADILADIYNGTIKAWNDPAIAKVNPGVTLPNTPIIVVHRSDNSGTTFVFTDYLTKASKHWTLSKGVTVNWPVGLGGKGNEGVSGIVKQEDGAIGYIELIYAQQNNIPFGSVQNADGKFVKASLDSVTAAAGTAQMPDDFRVSITNAPGKEAYPICSFTWLLIKQTISGDGGADKQKAIKDFLKWMLDDGQGMTKALVYAPLPKPVVEKEKKQIDLLQ